MNSSTARTRSAFADVNELGGQTTVRCSERARGKDLRERRRDPRCPGLRVRVPLLDVADGPERIAMVITRVDGSTRGKAGSFADRRGPHETLVDEYAVVEGLPLAPTSACGSRPSSTTRCETWTKPLRPFAQQPLQRLLCRDRRGGYRLDHRDPPRSAGPASPLFATWPCKGAAEGQKE